MPTVARVDAAGDGPRVRPGATRAGAAAEASPPALPLNPFHGGWAVAAATGRLVPRGAVRWLSGEGARLPVTDARRLGRLPLPHTAGLGHDHCFAGQPELGPEPQAGLAALTDAARGPVLSLSLVPADAPAHAALAAADGVIVQSRTRAMLRSDAGYDDYLVATIRGKKRKELRRLRARLEDEHGVSERVLGDTDDLPEWTDAFLALEAAGWKGEAGTAMAARGAERSYLALLLEGARDAGALRLYRLDVGGRLDAGERVAAMVIGLMGSDGGLYTYKIAHDPGLARYSPGVLAMLGVARHVLAGGATYADSCAREGHSMIEQLWGERRALHDWVVPKGRAGRLVTQGLLRAGKARRP